MNCIYHETKHFDFRDEEGDRARVDVALYYEPYVPYVKCKDGRPTIEGVSALVIETPGMTMRALNHSMLEADAIRWAIKEFDLACQEVEDSETDRREMES